MNVEQFYQSRQGDWKQLTGLLDRGQGNIHRLSPEEINTLGRLYRAATSDLALAQRDFPSHRITTYLNQLVGRAHAVIYRGEPMAGNRLWRFVSSGFPRIYRQTWPFILAAALLMILPAVVAGLATAWQPEAAVWLLPAEVQNLIPQIEEQELWTNIPIDERPYASAFIMTKNIRVAFLAFGSGALAGVLTVWIMIFNGLLLGGLTGLTAHYGVGFELWTFVIGHGVVELSVIFMAGGAGLSLGWAILRPGLLRRRDALALAARHSVRLIMGCVPLLVLAGTIEGFISPAEGIPWPVKWSIGIGSGLLLYSYLFLAGREVKK
ncbi:MAG: stage II sporulation protein M [Chloroflexi bacterium]|nr:stage II sporulation protein M [Chloroflexota bacterium]MCI0580080.1 stage II sporulation protein M [Chloroflexota bacterium]MCI0649344.1 stage II sporulation protein M [Chloroflexota bacterium]MCI0726040.1 stage II sporulation protein M [Chloroflexota bacterium]